MIDMRRLFISIIGFSAAILTGCTDSVDEGIEENPYLNGVDKTPINIVANLSTASNAMTRAYDNMWEASDDLLTYIQAGKVSSENAFVEEEGNPYFGLFPFLVGSSPDNEEVEGQQNTNKNTVFTTKIYWDDFSSTDYDLRSENPKRGIRLLYGYCYNGGVPVNGLADTENSSNTPALEKAGVITWAVQTNQNEDDNFKKSDLLFAQTQSPIQYHRTTPELVVPYLHAMSKVTIDITCGDEFDADKDNFKKTVLTLYGMNTTCKTNAPTGVVSDYTGNEVDSKQSEIIMKSIPDTESGKENLHRTFTALIAPSVMKNSSATFVHISDVDDNYYDIVLTNDILQTAAESGEAAWSTQLATYSIETVTASTGADFSTANGGLTKPGVNYVLKVKINKQKIDVVATVRAWDEVTAKADGIIKFESDVTDKTGEIADILKSGGFDIYKYPTATAVSGDVTNESYDSNTTADGVNPATKVIWTGDPEAWTYDPVIYWQNKDDNQYFRALAPTNASTSLANGTEVMWATTIAGDGYEAGALLRPRTGNVNFEFSHVMSKITFLLEDTNKGSSDPNATLDFTNATIQITNMANTGTLNLHNGKIVPGAVQPEMLSKDEEANPKRMGFYAAKENGVATSYSAGLVLNEYVVIPQTITDKAAVGNEGETDYVPAVASYVIITLANGTTYRVKLNTCETNLGTEESPDWQSITEWEPGKHYTYIITLSKEQIKFRASVKNWEEKTGQGNATLDWD